MIIIVPLCSNLVEEINDTDLLIVKIAEVKWHPTIYFTRDANDEMHAYDSSSSQVLSSRGQIGSQRLKCHAYSEGPISCRARQNYVCSCFNSYPDNLASQKKCGSCCRRSLQIGSASLSDPWAVCDTISVPTHNL